MRRNRRRIQARTLVAITLISASFLSAYVLSSLANRTQLFWSARSPLVVGSMISDNDLVAQRVAMPDGNDSYISVEHDITHFVVVKPIGIGELLPASAITRSSNALLMSAVPISVHSSDLPANLMPGEPINLYHVGDPDSAKEVGPPNIVLAHAYILGIDRKGQNLGGDLTLTISVNIKNVLQVLAATASGRVVVVRVNG